MLHEFVAVASAFENSWFDAARAVGDFAVGDLLQELATAVLNVFGWNVATGKRRPAGE